MSLNNKNIIIGFSEHIFTKLYIDMLVTKCNVDSKNICLIALNDIKDSAFLTGTNIQNFSYKDCSFSDLEKCKTITLISLTSINSAYIKKAFEFSDEIIKKTFIHITDDEVNRWVKTKDKYGKLKDTKKNHTNKDCIFVLNKALNFIAPNEPFKAKLEYVTGRNNFKLYDARDAFRTMPSNIWEQFNRLYVNDSEYTNPEKKILIGAKRRVFSLPQILRILHYLHKHKLLPEFKCMIFTHEKRKVSKIIIDLYLIYLKYFKKCNVNISFQSPTNNITYNALIMSCSDIILQGRGSMTTARCFVSIGKGVIHVKKDSPNDIELTRSEGIEVANYLEFNELALNIKNNNIDISNNKEKIEHKYRLKYNVLSSIYN